MNRKVEMLVKGNGCSADDLWVFPRSGQDKDLASRALLWWAAVANLD